MLHRNLTLLAVTATLSLAGCQKQAALAPEPPRPVKMAVVPASTNFRTLILSGTIKSRIESNLSFRVSGKILERQVDIGQRVRSGDVLARIDTIDLKLGLRTANASVDGAKARLRVAQDEFNRYQSLFDHGIVAQSALDRTKLEADQAEAALNQAIAMREQSANQTNYAELTADAPGIVTAIAAEVGQVVSAGTPVFTVSREDEMEAAINIPEQEIRYFSENMPVDVTYWAEPQLVTHGHVREIAGAADPASRTFSVKVSLTPDNRIRLGQTATVSAQLPIHPSGPTLPLSALVQHDGQMAVWIIDPLTETVHARVVAAGTAVDEGIIITNGLSQGEWVVTAGTQFLVEGQKIKPIKANLAQASTTATPID